MQKEKVKMNCEKIKEICEVEGQVRLVISIGYAKEDDKIRTLPTLQKCNDIISWISGNG